MSQRQSRHTSLDHEIKHPDLTRRVYNMQCLSDTNGCLVAPWICLLRQHSHLPVTTSWVCSWIAMGIVLMSRAPDPVLVIILLSNAAVIDTGA